VGSSSLVGGYTCSYRPCSGSFAQWRRFQALDFAANGIIYAKASVCSPECAAAYNRYVQSASDPESDVARARHRLLEKAYGRHIVPAPRAPTTERLAWLQVCRAQLSAAEAEVAERELTVQQAGEGVSSVPHIK